MGANWGTKTMRRINALTRNILANKRVRWTVSIFCLFGAVSVLGSVLLSKLPSAGMIDESGLQPWENCALCHSLDGVSRMAKFPKLAGQPAAYIEKQIWDFRKGLRTNDNQQMRAMADLIAEEDIPIAAKYFQDLPPPPPTPVEEGIDLTLVETIALEGNAPRRLPACLSCHAADKVATSGAARLEAQHADYIAKQLRDFKSGERSNDPDGVMQGVAALLTETEMEALGAFFEARTRDERE